MVVHLVSRVDYVERSELLHQYNNAEAKGKKQVEKRAALTQDARQYGCVRSFCGLPAAYRRRERDMACRTFYPDRWAGLAVGRRWAVCVSQ